MLEPGPGFWLGAGCVAILGHSSAAALEVVHGQHLGGGHVQRWAGLPPLVNPHALLQHSLRMPVTAAGNEKARHMAGLRSGGGRVSF